MTVVSTGEPAAAAGEWTEDAMNVMVALSATRRPKISSSGAPYEAVKWEGVFGEAMLRLVGFTEPEHNYEWRWFAQAYAADGHGPISGWVESADFDTVIAWLTSQANLSLTRGSDESMRVRSHA